MFTGFGLVSNSGSGTGSSIRRAVPDVSSVTYATWVYVESHIVVRACFKYIGVTLTINIFPKRMFLLCADCDVAGFLFPLAWSC